MYKVACAALRVCAEQGTFIMNCLALMAALLVLPAAPQGKGPSLAVLNLEHKAGVSGDTAELLTQNLITTLSSQGRFGRVIGTKEIESVIGFEKQRQLMACDSQSCIAELAGSMGVDYVLTGSLGKLGVKYLFNATLVNTHNAEVEGRVSKTISGNDDSALLEAVEGVVAELLRGTSAASAAPVAVAPLPPPSKTPTPAPAKPAEPAPVAAPPPAKTVPTAQPAEPVAAAPSDSNTPPAQTAEPVAANATPETPPPTTDKPAEGGGGGMMGVVLKGVGAAGLGVGALTLLVSVAGFGGGLLSAALVMMGVTLGRAEATAGNAGFYGGLGVGALGLVLTLGALGLGVGLLVAGFVLG